jgi:hypothetical protein
MNDLYTQLRSHHQPPCEQSPSGAPRRKLMVLHIPTARPQGEASSYQIGAMSNGKEKQQSASSLK